MREPTETINTVDTVSPYEDAAVVAAGVALTAAPLNLHAVPAPARSACELLMLARLAELHVTIARLAAPVAHHSVGGLDMTMRRVGGRTVVDVFAWSIHELSNWFDVYPGAGLAVSSRAVPAGSGFRGLGGLDWALMLGEVLPGVHLSIVTESLEDEELPDTALVRAAGFAPRRARTLAVAA
jgi:hypothetical protein